MIKIMTAAKLLKLLTSNINSYTFFKEKYFIFNSYTFFKEKYFIFNSYTLFKEKYFIFNSYTLFKEKYFYFFKVYLPKYFITVQEELILKII